MKVKALSFRQPWAELVLQGKKTLDLRTWSTPYRGPLAIYASQTVEKDRCQEHGIDPARLTTGAVIGLVDLVGVVELDAAAYAARAGEHLGGRSYHPPMFGWELSNPRPLAEPVPAKGRLLLFEVEIPATAEIGRPEVDAGQAVPGASPDTLAESLWSDALPFELRVHPESDPKTGQTGLGLSAIQERIVMLGGTLEIKTSPAAGTTVQFSLHLQQKSSTRKG